MVLKWKLTVISDFDGALITLLVLYQIENRNDNVYTVQTAGHQIMTSFGNHPYQLISQALLASIGRLKEVRLLSRMLTWLASLR